MPNLSQEKRQRMLAFLDTIRQEHKDDDDVLIALGEIESELNAKKYGLVWEQHEEAVDVMMRTHIPVFTEDAGKEITTSAGGVYQDALFDTGPYVKVARKLPKSSGFRAFSIYSLSLPGAMTACCLFWKAAKPTPFFIPRGIIKRYSKIKRFNILLHRPKS